MILQTVRFHDVHNITMKRMSRGRSDTFICNGNAFVVFYRKTYLKYIEMSPNIIEYHTRDHWTWLNKDLNDNVNILFLNSQEEIKVSRWTISVFYLLCSLQQILLLSRWKSEQSEWTSSAIVKVWFIEVQNRMKERRGRGNVGNKRENNSWEKRKCQETKKRSIEKWKIEDASTGKKMAAKTRVTYQRTEAESGVEERNVEHRVPWKKNGHERTREKGRDEQMKMGGNTLTHRI